MTLLLRNIRLGLEEPEEALAARAAQKLRIPAEAIKRCKPQRRSLDARDEADIHYVYHLELDLTGGVSAEKALLRKSRMPQVTVLHRRRPVDPEPGNTPLPHRPVVIGFGPAGMFAALKLAQMGYQPIVYERGRDVSRRHLDVLKKYYQEGIFNPASNLLFGEGGAGTYSDGKLYTRVSDPLVHSVLKTFCDHGADPNILVDAKPHVGSEKLPTICRHIREHIEELGGEIRFDACLDDLRIADGVLTAIQVNDQWESVGPVILAIGHSARDTLRMLAAHDVALAAKPFQLGVRIEHPQAMVSKWQYGACANHDRLPPADYKLVAKNVAGDLGDLFSFCMCPGGTILPSNESVGQISTNGASKSKRDGPFANAGLVVTITPELIGDDPLAGLDYQQKWEEAAFKLTGGSYKVPCHRASDFLAGKLSSGKLETSFPLGGQWCDIRECIPAEVSSALEKGLRLLDKRMPGFAGDSGIITGPETRASAPVRILRDKETRLSTSTQNLYPVGEGAGYAGGIVSSAIDGLRTAFALVGEYAPAKC